jgi:phosphopantothenoylcysteine synthetase/decarboxylase
MLDAGDLEEVERGDRVMLLQVRRPCLSPLALLLEYMDLAEINDPSACVVACAFKGGMEVRGDDVDDDDDDEEEEEEEDGEDDDDADADDDDEEPRR